MELGVEWEVDNMTINSQICFAPIGVKGARIVREDFMTLRGTSRDFIKTSTGILKWGGWRSMPLLKQAPTAHGSA